MKARFLAGKPAQENECTSRIILNLPGVELLLNAGRVLQI
jgi:hypothetical protein